MVREDPDLADGCGMDCAHKEIFLRSHATSWLQVRTPMTGAALSQYAEPMLSSVTAHPGLRPAEGQPKSWSPDMRKRAAWSGHEGYETVGRAQ
jgi:hypothetical protein